MGSCSLLLSSSFHLLGVLSSPSCQSSDRVYKTDLSEPGEGLDAVPGLTRLSSRPFRTSCQTGRALIEQRHELLDLTAWLSHPCGDEQAG
jgi:hypothetical protein